MKKGILILFLLFAMAIPVSAEEYSIPEVPDHAQGLLPDDRDTFAEGLWYVIRTAFDIVQPDIAQCGRVAISVLAVAILIGFLHSQDGPGKQMVSLAGCVAVGLILLQPVGTQVANAQDTVTQLSEYGKLLLPVMTAALAAQGGAATSAALYGATIAFDAKGVVTTDLTAALQTKIEKGTNYGMAAYGQDLNGDGVVKEWNEQGAAFDAALAGKTATEIAALEVKGYGVESVQTAGCTIAISDMVKAAVKAATVA